MLLEQDCEPVALITAKGRRAECADEMRRLLPKVPFIEGKQFREQAGAQLLRRLEPDYFLSVHFPYIIPQPVLDLAKIGTLNLHPAYLPYNRGWHTPTWAIWEQTPYGATLHWIESDDAVDNGPIAIRRELTVRPEETAHTLYQRVLALELEVLREAIPMLLENALPSYPQEGSLATSHTQQDIVALQPLCLTEKIEVGDLLRLLRALTTSDRTEAAYFQIDDAKYYVQVDIRREEER
jgi:methionyl-tRNA formyltransferase